MPTSIGIMLKFSEVRGDGLPNPNNYYEQLLRCSGLAPINTVATINNRHIIGEIATDIWENVFLSDTLKNGASRYRSRLDTEGFLFTRAGCLLNLKFLLGMQPVNGKFKETAIGAISLHANDYIEGVDTSSLAHGALAVVTELAPVWEVQNIRDPRRLLFRSYDLYKRFLADARMQSLFTTPVSDLTFAGLSYKEYFTLLFGMYTNAHNGTLQVPPTSIIDAADIARKAHISTDAFATFVGAKALTLDRAHELFGPFDRDTFLAKVGSSAWTSNQLALRQHPLLAMPDGRFLALDLQFLFENASAGLSWSLRAAVPDEKGKQFLDWWGVLFEAYGRSLLEFHYPDQTPAAKNYVGGQIDALLMLGSDAINFEIKAGFIRDDVKGARDQARLDAALRKKYVTDAKEKRVGVRQLAQTSKALLDGTAGVRADRVYPILVGEDPILQTLGMNTYLDDIFRSEANDKRIMPLTVMLIDELEELLPHLSSGDMTWQEFLARRNINGRAAGETVHTTFADLANERRFKRRAEMFLAGVGEELIAMIKDTYKDLE